MTRGGSRCTTKIQLIPPYLATTDTHQSDSTLTLHQLETGQHAVSTAFNVRKISETDGSHYPIFFASFGIRHDQREVCMLVRDLVDLCLI